MSYMLFMLFFHVLVLFFFFGLGAYIWISSGNQSAMTLMLLSTASKTVVKFIYWLSNFRIFTWLTFLDFSSLIKFSNLSSNFLHMLIMVILHSVSDNSSIWIISVSVSIVYIFSCSCLFVWLVIFNQVPDIAYKKLYSLSIMLTLACSQIKSRTPYCSRRISSFEAGFQTLQRLVYIYLPLFLGYCPMSSSWKQEVFTKATLLW